MCYSIHAYRKKLKRDEDRALDRVREKEGLKTTRSAMSIRKKKDIISVRRELRQEELSYIDTMKAEKKMLQDRIDGVKRPNKTTAPMIVEWKSKIKRLDQRIAFWEMFQ